MTRRKTPSAYVPHGLIIWACLLTLLVGSLGWCVGWAIEVWRSVL